MVKFFFFFTKWDVTYINYTSKINKNVFNEKNFSSTGLISFLHVLLRMYIKGENYTVKICKI